MPSTPGGKRLRALRELYNKTQLDVELDASLGIGYLQRLELGKVQQPECDTLERILLALNAHYSERRDVLELFGYMVDAPIPVEEEVRWAIKGCDAELDSAVFPAYLLDCAHRLLYWNRLVSLLFDTTHIARPLVNPPRPDRSANVSMLKMVFDPACDMSGRIKNIDVFFPAQIRALRYEMQRFQDEPWYAALMQDMFGCRNFEQSWNRERYATVHIAARPLTPLELDSRDHGLLRFRLISEPFVQDHRFRVLYYIPADSITASVCLRCLQDEAVD